MCNSDDDFYAGMSEIQYLTWMGMAAKIQQRNQVVDQQCRDLQKKILAKGVNSCILKGQGVATLYGENLRGLRQSGDIDIFLPVGFERSVEIAQNFGSVGSCSYVHLEWNVLDSTEVELHYRPSSMRNLIVNHRFQKWINTMGENFFVCNEGIVTPSLEFNRIYLLQHCYRHVIGAGIGIRQLMDYYFCLKSQKMSNFECTECQKLLKSFGLLKFAGAVMYVLNKVFGLEREFMVCEPNAKEWEFFLKQTMLGGNFGRYDNRIERDGSVLRFVIRKLFMNLRYAMHYPSELIWAPVWRIYSICWKRNHKYQRKKS